MRKAVFVLTATDHGTMIVSRMDWQKVSDTHVVGVGVQLLETSVYDKGEVDTAVGLLELRRMYFGDGVVALDGGANVGVHTIEWAKAMTGWGKVLAVEAQELVFYALAGNITINNCLNARAIHAAISDQDGVIDMPVPDYTTPCSLGGLEIEKLSWTLHNGQDMPHTAPVRAITIDALGLERLDLLKLDIEGMEMKALAGAEKTIEGCHPLLHIEHIKTGPDEHAGVDILCRRFEGFGYETFRFGANLVGVHRLDKTLEHVQHLHRSLLREQLLVQEVA